MTEKINEVVAEKEHGIELRKKKGIELKSVCIYIHIYIIMPCDTAPMVEGFDGISRGGGGGREWCGKVLDMEETKTQMLFALPMIATNVSYYAITLVSVMFAGHLGELELASSNLGNSWATVTGFALMVSHV